MVQPAHLLVLKCMRILYIYFVPALVHLSDVLLCIPAVDAGTALTEPPCITARVLAERGAKIE